MRKLKLYIATSLNGYIAQEDGSVAWLDSFPPPKNEDYGYAQFQKSTDTTIQGYSTYKQLLDWAIDFPYTQRYNYVITRDKKRKDNKDVQFVSSDPIAFISDLKKEKGKDIWLIGGGQINTMCFNAQLIDEIQVFIMPIILSAGIQLFENIPKETNLELIDSKTYSSGVVEMIYKPK